MFQLLALALPGVIPGVPALADLYVDAAADCSSSNGLLATPFCTITEAVTVAVDGDVIWIAPGTYSEHLSLATDITLRGRDGESVTRIDGSRTGTVVAVQIGAEVVIDGLTIAQGDPVGVLNRGHLTMENSTVTTNAFGVLHESTSGPLTMRNCSVTSNFYVDAYNYPAGVGAGLVLREGGPVTLKDCTVHGNRAFRHSAIKSNRTPLLIQGTTISNNFAERYEVAEIRFSPSAPFEMVNSTVSGNHSGGFTFSGDGTGAAAIRSSTIVGNTGAYYAYGIQVTSFGTVELTNTVVAESSQNLWGTDVIGAVISGGDNFIGSVLPGSPLVDGVNNDRVGLATSQLDPMLGPLADNGGPTLTRGPLPGSPLIDTGNQVAFETRDQRGLRRMAGLVNVGALEDGIGGTIPGCTTLPNSSGDPAFILAAGSFVAAGDDLLLTAVQLPVNQFGIFLVSATAGFVPNAGGAIGHLCLGGAIGRFVGANQVLVSGPSGTFALQVPLNQIPQGSGFVSLVAGETWNFQAWFRDVAGGTAASNYSEGIQLTFR